MPIAPPTPFGNPHPFPHVLNHVLAIGALFIVAFGMIWAETVANGPLIMPGTLASLLDAASIGLFMAALAAAIVRIRIGAWLALGTTGLIWALHPTHPLFLIPVALLLLVLVNLGLESAHSRRSMREWMGPGRRMVDVPTIGPEVTAALHTTLRRRSSRWFTAFSLVLVVGGAALFFRDLHEVREFRAEARTDFATVAWVDEYATEMRVEVEGYTYTIPVNAWEPGIGDRAEVRHAPSMERAEIVFDEFDPAGWLIWAALGLGVLLINAGGRARRRLQIMALLAPTAHARSILFTAGDPEGEESLRLSLERNVPAFAQAREFHPLNQSADRMIAEATGQSAARTQVELAQDDHEHAADSYEDGETVEYTTVWSALSDQQLLAHIAYFDDDDGWDDNEDPQGLNWDHEPALLVTGSRPGDVALLRVSEAWFGLRAGISPIDPGWAQDGQRGGRPNDSSGSQENLHGSGEEGSAPGHWRRTWNPSARSASRVAHRTDGWLAVLINVLPIFCFGLIADALRLETGQVIGTLLFLAPILLTWHWTTRKPAKIIRSGIELRGLFVDRRVPWGQITGVLTTPKHWIVLRLDHADDGHGDFELLPLDQRPPVVGARTNEEAGQMLRAAWAGPGTHPIQPIRRVLSPTVVLAGLWLALLLVMILK